MRSNNRLVIDTRFSKLKELIENELGIDKASQLIVDEKGIDISCSHSDELICSEKKKQLVIYT